MGAQNGFTIDVGASQSRGRRQRKMRQVKGSTVSAQDQGQRQPFVSEPARPLAIVLTGAGRAFCADMDMEELEVLPPEDIQAEQWMRPFDISRCADYQTSCSYFLAVPKPIITAINGAAAGPGVGDNALQRFPGSHPTKPRSQRPLPNAVSSPNTALP